MLILYKNRTETPLQALEKMRQQFPEYKNTVLSYAGRLDPMAEGVMLVLVGEEENRNREKYLGLDKEYEVEILFGIETDTYDILGKVTHVLQNKISQENIKNNILNKYTGEFEQEYPPYSSKPVQGKPLFMWAREGKLHDIDIPKKLVHISNTVLKNFREITAQKLYNEVTTDLYKVVGDFRQQEILDSWKILDKNPDQEFILATIQMTCTSGTYMRSLAHTIGKELGMGALAYRIVRRKIGDYNIDNSLYLKP